MPLENRVVNRGRRGFTVVEGAIVIVVIVILLAFAVLYQHDKQEISNRVNCAANLRTIGQAMLLYSNDNKGSYPRVRRSAGPLRTPVYGTGVNASNPLGADGPAENDVTAALFLLLRTQDIRPQVFVCPASRAVPDLDGFAAIKQRSNFTDYRLNLSYSLHNPYFDDAAVAANAKWNNTSQSTFATAADINPGTAGDGDNVFAPGARASSPDEQRTHPANSNNHAKRGQNVLFGDGHVEFCNSPCAGTNGDNIYTTRDGKLNASPRDIDDTVLLPSDD